MKTTIIALLASVIFLGAQTRRPGVWGIAPRGPSAADIARAEERERERQTRIQQAKEQKEIAEAKRNFIPKDPWRVIGTFGASEYAKGANWYQFSGTIQQVHHDGIRIKGWYGYPFDFTSEEMEFFVANFPYERADGETISATENFTAKEAGVHEYATAIGSHRTIRKLDYGRRAPAPRLHKPSVAQQQLREAKAAQQKAALEAKVLAYHQQLAEKGDAYGLCQMGLRYLSGNGVEKDEARGRALLRRAADEGSREAKAVLENEK